MNDRRVLAYVTPLSGHQVSAGDIISDELCQQMTDDAGINAWLLAGVIHCPYRMRRRVRREIKRLLPKSLSRPIHLNRRRIRMARAPTNWLPVGRGSILQQISGSNHCSIFRRGRLDELPYRWPTGCVANIRGPSETSIRPVMAAG